MALLHITHEGEIQHCRQEGTCGNPFGHYLDHHAALEERIRLASEGKLYLAGIGDSGKGWRR